MTKIHWVLLLHPIEYSLRNYSLDCPQCIYFTCAEFKSYHLYHLNLKEIILFRYKMIFPKNSAKLTVENANLKCLLYTEMESNKNVLPLIVQIKTSTLQTRNLSFLNVPDLQINNLKDKLLQWLFTQQIQCKQ